MNNDRIERALNFLDDDLISEAADYAPPKKAKPVHIFKYSAAAACLLAVIIGAFALKSALLPDADKIASLENPADSSDYVSSILSSLDQLTSSNDSSPGSDYLNPTITEWFDNPEVIWYSGQPLKGSTEADPPKLGTTEVTDKLKSLMNENPDAIFAVKVSFALYQDKSERDNWKYGNTTIIELANQIKALSLEMDISESTEVDKVKLEMLKDTLQLALYNYYMDKFQGFMETFNANNIGFYCITSPEATKTEDYNYFICFATADQINNFTCKPTEAFVFDTIPKDSARSIF